MMNGIEEINVEDKFNEIYNDITTNIRDVLNREHYYTHKYRGNVVTDINVAIEDLAKSSIIRIFLKNKVEYIHCTIIVKDNEIIDTDTTKKLIIKEDDNE